MATSARRVCSVCCGAVAAYTCPRCHKAYCNAQCYKTHSTSCTEAFFREQATSELKATRAGPEQTQQMVAILQRLHEQQAAAGLSSGGGAGIGPAAASSSGGSSDEDAGDDEETSDDEHQQQRQHAKLSPELEKLLRRAEAQGADAFDVSPADLTPQLVAELEALALTGQLSHLVPAWQPWWELPAAGEVRLNQAGQAVVQELHATNGSSSSQRAPHSQQQHLRVCLPSGVPAAPDAALPQLAVLAGAAHRPSRLLPWQLLQLLVAYCGVLRRFNGEPDEDSGWEAGEQLLLLAPPLAHVVEASRQPQQQQQGDGSQQQQQQQQQQQVMPDSARSACVQLMDAAAALHSPSPAADSRGSVLPAEQRALLQVATADALKLLQLGRPGVLLALTDSHRLLLQARAHVKAAAVQLQQQQHKRLAQHLGLAARKVWYLLAWGNEARAAMFEALAAELAGALQEQQAMAAAQVPAAGVVLPSHEQPSQVASQPKHTTRGVVEVLD